MGRILWVGVSLLALGCSGGDDGGLGSSSCELDVSVTGALQWSNSAAPACLIPFGGDAGIEMIFVSTAGTVSRFTVDVDGVAEGQLGVFPATVRVEAEDGRAWASADCSVELTRHDFESEDDFSKGYLASGTGSCVTAAIAEGGGADGDVTVAPFAFRFPPRW